MKNTQLTFGKFIQLNDSVFEIIIDEGIELTVEMLEMAFAEVFVASPNQIGLLVNKLNEYTYSFDAQMYLGNFAKVKATAFVTYSLISKETTKSVATLPRRMPFNHKIFDDREKALNWLEGEMKI